MEYVDLGLPSGKKWAKCNLGANFEDEEGLFFQWGDIVGYTRESIEKESNYKWYSEGSTCLLKKYNNIDKKITLDLEDDAAYVILGENWRIPTREDIIELRKYTERCITSIKLGLRESVKVYKFLSKINSKELYFPILGTHTSFWSSSLCDQGSSYAYYMNLDDKGFSDILGFNCSCYRTIRPIYIG